MNHLNRIIDAIEELKVSFVLAGLQPPRSIEFDSKDDAMRFVSEFLRQDFFRKTIENCSKEDLSKIMLMGIALLIPNDQ